MAGFMELYNSFVYADEVEGVDDAGMVDQQQQEQQQEQQQSNPSPKSKGNAANPATSSTNKRPKVAKLSIPSPRSSPGTSSGYTSLSSSSPSPSPSAPAPSPTWIDPYGLPANAPSPNINLDTTTRGFRTARRILANSGVSTWTNYPLSTSPRETRRQIKNSLWELGEDARQATKRVGCSLEAQGTPLVVKPSALFAPFSWDAPAEAQPEEF
ncbi:hypothetical protein Q7P37_008328 [Cladosporium fusiforme]